MERVKVTPARPPAPAQRPKLLEAQGETRVDPYYWLRDKTDPEVIAYLAAENAYAHGVLAGSSALEEKLYREIVGFDLPAAGAYATGIAFLPPEKSARTKVDVEKVLADEGFDVLGWRAVPVDPNVPGKSARELMPVFEQVFVAKNGLVEVVPWVLLKGNNLHSSSVTSTRSAGAGLKTRPLAETLRDTAAWWPTTASS